MTVCVRRYDASLRDDWEAVLGAAKNSIFQFDRKYIEYHGERFNEISLVAYVDGTPVALFPAALDVTSGLVTSHPGLTFGGVVLRTDLRGSVAISVIEEVLSALKVLGGKSCLIKQVPPSFTRYPSGELDYVLWRRGFKLARRDLSSVLPLRDSLPFSEMKRRAVKRAVRNGLVYDCVDVDGIYKLMTSVLHDRYGVAPVHSRDELALLVERFPNQILLRSAKLGGVAIAGTVVYCYRGVWHTQYLANSDKGRELGALDLVVHELCEEARLSNIGQMSFGTSSTEEGRTINEGLLRQKEGFGARSITHDFMLGEL